MMIAYEKSRLDLIYNCIEQLIETSETVDDLKPAMNALVDLFRMHTNATHRIVDAINAERREE